MLGTKTLHDILADREEIANTMESLLDQGSSPWGIKIERVEMYVFDFLFFFVVNF